MVAIATESGNHARIAVDCIRHGCNVIIEKPIALSLRDADQILQLAKEKNVKVCACHQNRFNKSIQKIREAVEQGRFGRMFYGTASYRWNRGPPVLLPSTLAGNMGARWRRPYEQCIHNIDLLRWMMGDR